MATKTNRFSGLTDDQVLMIFGQIATTANLMAAICRERADEYGAKEIALTLHALDTMLLGVGALADLPTGGHTVGDFSAWMLGPLFHRTQSGGGAV